MRSFTSIAPLVLAVGLAILSGCASKPEPKPLPLEVTFEVTRYEPDMREYHSSWGHSGRGGAALRKPTYQPVLGSLSVLETQAGKLYPELQPHYQNTESIAVPVSMIQTNCADRDSVAQAFALGESVTGNRIVTLANSEGSVEDYIQVRNKLCKGALRLTYHEWQILVKGTPKDVPLYLQTTPFHNYK